MLGNDLSRYFQDKTVKLLFKKTLDLPLAINNIQIQMLLNDLHYIYFLHFIF